MKKKVAASALAVALAVGGMLFASPAMAKQGTVAEKGDHKVLVCKYVGTPGVNETLKGGENPISVDKHTLKDWDGETFPWEFPDAQGKSIAVAWDEGQEDAASLCPPAQGPVDPEPEPEPTKVTPPTPTFEDPCGVNNLTVNTPETKGVVWSVNQIGNKTKVAATAAEGYVLEGTTTWEFKDSGVLCPPNPPTNAVCESPEQGPVGTNLNGLWANVDTRPAGHYEYVDGGLKVWTDDATSNAKVSLGTSADFALKATGALSINWDGTTPPPGVNLFVDFDNDGTNDGTLVYEGVYGQDLWLTSGSKSFVKDAAPSHTGGNGSENHGTINEWLTVFPEAQVHGIAFSLGSGVHGNGVLKSITVGCVLYTFDHEEKVVEPIPVTLTVPEWTDECGVEDDGAMLPTDTEGVHYMWATDDPDSPNYWTVRAWIEDGYTAQGTVGWTAFDGGYEFVIPMTDKACEVEPTPTPKPTTPGTTTPGGKGDSKTVAKTASADTLAQTGGDMSPILPIAGGIAVMAGLATLVLRRITKH